MAGMKDLADLTRELEDQLALCIRCGMCQAVCPLFEQTRREADVARGKLALLDGLMKNMFENPDGVAERLNRCLLCGSCAANCPSGVNVVEIFIRARAILADYKGLSPIKKLVFKKMLANPDTFDRMTGWAGKFQGVVSRKENNPQETSCARLISPLLSGRHLVPMANQPFHEAVSGVVAQPGAGGLKVLFYTGCLIDKIYPRIGHATLDVLKAGGVGITVPEGQGCCGIPALASGDRETFDRLVKHNVDLFSSGTFDYVVTSCATCTSTIKKLWPALCPDQGSRFQERVRELADKTMDINGFMVKKMKIPVSGENTGESGRRVTYHDPCHLKKSLNVFEEPREVIRASGNTLVEMTGADHCCGMGGSFNLFHYELSSRIGEMKQENIQKTGCDIVATGCPACMMQISDMLAKAGSAVKVRHPVELYAQSLAQKEKVE